MVLQLFRSPAKFMDGKAGRTNLRLEIIIVLLIGAFGVLGNAFVAREIDQAVEMEALRFPLLAFSIEPLLEIFLIWIGYAIGLHLIANRVYNARGPVFRVVKLAAWALIPLAIANLLRSGITYFAFQDVDYVEIIQEEEFTGFVGTLEPILEAGMAEPIYLLSPLVFILGILASGYLLIHAVEQAKGITREQARNAVGIVLGIHVLYILWVIIGMAGTLF